MKKILSFLLLGLMCSIGNVWADDLIVSWKTAPTTSNDSEGCSTTGTKNNLATWADGTTVKIMRSDKDVTSGNDITISGTAYKSIKVSNGAQNLLTMPTGVLAYKVTFYSYVNKDSGTAYWYEVNGDESDRTDHSSFKDGANPDVRVFDLGGVSSFTFTNTGQQLCYVIVISTEPEAAETRVATPTYSLGDWDAVNSKYSVTLSCSTSGSTIHYSTDNKTSYLDYSAALALAPGSTLDAYATKDGLDQSENMAQYVVPAAPTYFTITYANADGAEGIVPAAVSDAENGDVIVLPSNFSMYKDGYTMTGWNDGTNNYDLGANYTVSGNATLTAVYTANAVELSDHIYAVTIKWLFSQSAGVPAIYAEGGSAFVVAQADVDGNSIDVKLPIDATSGKFANSANSWTQVNPGTIFTIPSEEGAVITYKQYDNGDVTTPEINVTSTGATYSLTAAGTSGSLYYEYIQVVLPSTVESSEYLLIDNGVLNTTDFRGSFSLKDESYTVSEVAYTNCIALGSGNQAMEGLYAQNKFVAYDSKTDATSIEIAVWNKNSSNKNLVILVVPEGAEKASCVPETIQVTAKTGYVKSIQMTGRSSLYCSVESTDIRFCQITVTESGNNLPMAGEVGYSVNHNVGRLAANNNNNEGGSLDGMEYKVSSSVKLLSSTETKISTLGTHYVKFTAPSNVRLQVTTNNTAHYYVADSKNGTTNEVSPTANTASNIDLAAGTWYINPAGSDVKITNIAFVAQPTKYAITFDLQGHGDAIDAQNLEAGEVVVEPTAPTASGYAFGGWYKEAGCTNAWDFANDVVTEATVLYAKWTAAFNVTYYNGETELGSEAVISGNSPVDYETYQARAHYSFDAWYNNADLAEEHIITDISALIITEATSVYGKWTLQYSTSLDLEAYANASPNTNATGQLDAAYFIYADVSNSNIDKTTTNNGAFAGLKLKSTDAYIEALVPAGKVFTIKLGSMAAAGEMYIDGVLDDTYSLTGGSTSSGDNYKVYSWCKQEDALYRFKATTGSTCTVKGLFITDAFVLSTEDNDYYGLYLPWEVVIPSGINAYTGALSGDALILTQIEGSVIPAATPVIVKSPTTTGDFNFVLGTTSAAAIANNDLEGVIEATTVASIEAANSDMSCLTLGADSEGNVAFRQPAGSSIAANKVYLLVTASEATAPIRIVLGENNTTDIKTVENSDKAVKFFENGNLYILRDGNVYDAMGKMVR